MKPTIKPILFAAALLGAPHARARTGPALDPVLKKVLNPRTMRDADLVMRYLEVKTRFLAQDVRYGPRHPRIKELKRRLSFLLRSILGSPVAGPGELRRLVLQLRRNLAALAAIRSNRMATFQAKHPAVVGLDRGLTFLRKALAKTRRSIPPIPSAALKYDAVVAAVETRARLAYLRNRYAPNHPRARNARAVLKKLATTIGTKPLPSGPFACKSLRAAYNRAIRNLNAERSTVAPYSAAAEETDAALDALFVKRAKLQSSPLCTQPSKVGGR